jgi:(p)ppGpp synthase/HD superfamily hydrolase
MKMLALAIAITAEAFKNKLDRGGKPYILHCLYVLHKTHGSEDKKCAAVMHDLIEDTDWTYEMLREEGFSERVIDILKLLTHDKTEPYMDYVKRLAHDSDAKDIKKSDLEHNSKITRLKDVTKKDFDRIEKYHIAYKYLS